MTMMFIPKKFRIPPSYPVLKVSVDVLFQDPRFSETIARVIKYLHSIYVNYSDDSWERRCRPNTITEQFDLLMRTQDAYIAEIDLCNAIHDHALGMMTDDQICAVLTRFIDTHIYVHFEQDGFFQWKYKTGDSPRTGREIALYGLWWLPLRVRANCVVNEIQRYLYVKLESLSGNNAQYQLSSL